MSGWYPMDRFTPGDGDAGEPPEHVNVITGNPEMDEPEVRCDDCDGVDGHFPGCVWAIAHPAALVLADHLAAIGTRAPTSRAVCDCGWRGAACDYPAHLADVLQQAGLLVDGTPAEDTDHEGPRREGGQEDDDVSRNIEDAHPREDAVQVVYRALARLDCNVPVDPYDPDDIDSVACEAVWALIRAGLLEEDVYVMVCEDRHLDVEVQVFTSEAVAVAAAHRFVESNARHSGAALDLDQADSELNDAMRADGWVYYKSYSVEGDCVRVVRRALTRDHPPETSVW